MRRAFLRLSKRLGRDCCIIRIARRAIPATLPVAVFYARHRDLSFLLFLALAYMFGKLAKTASQFGRLIPLVDLRFRQAARLTYLTMKVALLGTANETA